MYGIPALSQCLLRLSFSSTPVTLTKRTSACWAADKSERGGQGKRGEEAVDDVWRKGVVREEWRTARKGIDRVTYLRHHRRRRTRSALDHRVLVYSPDKVGSRAIYRDHMHCQGVASAQTHFIGPNKVSRASSAQGGQMGENDRTCRDDAM